MTASTVQWMFALVERIGRHGYAISSHNFGLCKDMFFREASSTRYQRDFGVQVRSPWQHFQLLLQPPIFAGAKHSRKEWLVVYLFVFAAFTATCTNTNTPTYQEIVQLRHSHRLKK